MLDRFTPDARGRLDEQVTRIDPAHRDRPDLAGATRDACVRAVALACDGDTRLLARLAGDPALRPLLAGTASAIRVEHDRTRLRTFGPYDGRLVDPAAIAAIGRAFGPDKVLSPSQLETFISCPFQFFLRYVVRLDALDERDELDEDYTGRGSILHGILEELEQRLLQEPADRLGLSRALMQERLRSESTVVSEIDGGLREIERYRIDQMLTRYARQHEKYEQADDSGAARPHKFEVVFGDERRSDSHPCLVIGEGQEAVRLQGKIDRIDLVDSDGSEGFRVIDYKTGSCPTAKDVTGALYVQLPLYALAVERIVLLEHQPQLVDVGYWGLKKEGYRRIVL
ncbi:MAG: PD-(D/E)XK nuclease family protein, partial [Isosphaeraceae bacterium]|nr:PD-(D/E)XK nuclease family protein [Isosphaeraceae bacterium]